MKKILVIGSLNVDMVVHVDHIPVVGETILADTNAELVPGGKGANQAFAVGKLGGDVTMFGAVGDDSYAEIEKQSLSSANVDISNLLVKEGINTGLAWITVNAAGNNSIVVLQGANKALSVQDIEAHEDLIKNTDIVVLQLEIPIDIIIYAAKCAKKHGKMVILDPAPVPKHFPQELFQYIDIIKPNETEFAQILGEPVTDYVSASNILRQKGVPVVIVTLGPHGLFINSTETGTVNIDASPAEVVDTTAAGDTFTAALAVQLSAGKSLLEAVKYANKASSIVVSRKGAQSSIPSAEEVEQKPE